MDSKQKRICLKCNYSGNRQDDVYPYCGIRLISLCPEFQVSVKVAFARFCCKCGVQFSNTIANLNKLIVKGKYLQTGGAVGADTRDGFLSTKGASK